MVVVVWKFMFVENIYFFNDLKNLGFVDIVNKLVNKVRIWVFNKLMIEKLNVIG